MPDVIQFMVRDPQGNVYGPATMETLAQWVREGRITAAMQLAPEGTVDWKPAAAYPELQGLFAPDHVTAVLGTSSAAASITPTPPSSPTPPTPPNPYAATVPTTINYQSTGLSGQNSLAVVSMVLGIVGVFISSFGMCAHPCCGFGLGGPLSVAAVILAYVSRKQLKQNPGQTGQRMAMAGLICGIVGLALLLLLLILGLIFVIIGAKAGAFK